MGLFFFCLLRRLRMNRYSYDGPVMVFDDCVQDHFKAETMAISEKKARSNLTYQFKKAANLIAATKVSLPGKVVLVD